MSYTHIGDVLAQMRKPAEALEAARKAARLASTLQPTRHSI
jgi:hypothetical protein